MSRLALNGGNQIDAAAAWSRLAVVAMMVLVFWAGVVWIAMAILPRLAQ